MFKQVSTTFLQILVIAALILSGSGVQASPMIMGDMQLQGMSGDCTMDMAEDVAAAPDRDHSANNCQMEAENCHSSCATCQAVSGDVVDFPQRSAVPLPAFANLALASLQYPIEYPPKPFSSR